MSSLRQTLQAAFSERLARNPRYSLRAFARDLGLSPAGLSQILNGKQGMTAAKALQVAKRLGLNAEEQERFRMEVEAAHSRSEKRKREAAARLKAVDSDPNRISLDAFQVISDWQHFAILELVSLKSFRPSVDSVAKRLGLSKQSAKLAVERLVRLELLEVKENGPWRAKTDFTLVPGGVPSDAIKKFHRQVMEAALQALFEQPVENRNYSSTVMAVRKSDLPMVRERVKAFRIQLMKDLGSAPEKDSVYAFSTQFFELSRS